MSAINVEELIHIQEREVGDGTIEVRAVVTVVGCPEFYDKDGDKEHGGAWRLECLRTAREDLLRGIYEDRTREMHFALSELFSCVPYDIQKLQEARGRLLRAALRMPRRKLDEPKF